MQQTVTPARAKRAVAPLGLCTFISALGCTSSAGEATPSAELQATKVAVAKARAGALVLEHPLLGEVRAKAQVTLAAGEPGEVKRVSVREGDRVKRGQLLVLVDPTLARSRLHEARAQLTRVGEEREQAARDAARLSSAGKRLVAELEIEQASSRKAQLEAREAEAGAALAQAQAVLSRLHVRAPFDGQVKARLVDPGDWVNPGDATIELVAPERIEVLVDAPAELVPFLETGLRAELRRSEHDALLEAHVKGIVRALDARTRTATVRLVPSSVPEWLYPGGTVDVVFRIARAASGAVIVPRDALVLGAVGTRVVRVVDGRAKPTPVEVVAQGSTEALVRAQALAPADALVVRGNERLQLDQPLVVIERRDDPP